MNGDGPPGKSPQITFGDVLKSCWIMSLATLTRLATLSPRHFSLTVRNKQNDSMRQSRNARCHMPSLTTDKRRKVGQFLSSIPLSSQTAKNVAASRSASITSERSSTILPFSASISSLSVFKHSRSTQPHTRNTMALYSLTGHSILKAISIPGGSVSYGQDTRLPCKPSAIRKCLKRRRGAG